MIRLLIFLLAAGFGEFTIILNLLSPISVILLLILRSTQLSAGVEQPLGSRVRL